MSLIFVYEVMVLRLYSKYSHFALDSKCSMHFMHAYIPITSTSICNVVFSSRSCCTCICKHCWLPPSQAKRSSRESCACFKLKLLSKLDNYKLSSSIPDLETEIRANSQYDVNHVSLSEWCYYLAESEDGHNWSNDVLMICLCSKFTRDVTKTSYVCISY